MVNHANASHIGGILSVADIVAVLYSDVLHICSDDPKSQYRDRLVMSKGHCGVAVYIALAMNGFIPSEILDTYGENGSRLSCHISHHNVSGVEMTTGSLGHGCCVACGMALDGKLKKEAHQVYVIVGDGECNEGTVWEMAMFAAHQGLDNFTVIVDRNGMQAMGDCKDVLDMGALEAKWRAFGWETISVDGHDHAMLKEAFRKSRNGMPRAIIAKTIKGKGVSFMENDLQWHYRSPQGEWYPRAVRELGECPI